MKKALKWIFFVILIVIFAIDVAGFWKYKLKKSNNTQTQVATSAEGESDATPEETNQEENNMKKEKEQSSSEEQKAANENLLIRLNQNYGKLSKGQKRLADFITAHYDRAVSMTAARLGQQVGVSESTTVRFAMQLGYAGYPEFQRALEEMVMNRLNSVQRMQFTYGRVPQGEILETVLQSDIEKIKMTLEEVDRSAFERAADTILSARTIYIVGIRSCAPLASFLAFYLHMIFPDVRQVQTNSSSEIFEQMIRITEDDVVIGISFPRYSMRTMKALEFANSRKAKVITITDSVHSPMNVYAACTLIAKSDMASIVDSLVAPLSVINALVVALCMKRQADVKKTLESMEKLWDEYQVYSNDEINGLDDARPMGGKKAALPVKEKA